jgi:hypothetical protein
MNWASLAPIALVPLAACMTFDGLTARQSAPMHDAGSRGNPGLPLDQGSADASVAGTPTPRSYTSYLSLNEAASVCAKAFQCPRLGASILYSISVPADAANFSACMTWIAGPLPPSHPGIQTQRDLLTCVAHAQTCAQAFACTIYEMIDQGDGRCTQSTPTKTSCLDSATVLDCAGGTLEHCGVAKYTPSSTCGVDPGDGNARCLLRQAAQACTTTAWQCSDTYVDRCAGTIRERWDCATLGLSCQMGPNGYDCDGFDAACKSLTMTCGVAMVRVCNPPYVVSYDCASLGGACSDSGNMVRCARSDDACGLADPDVNTCSGTNLNLCVGGERKSIDCATIGLRCVAGAPPQTAHCGG